MTDRQETDRLSATLAAAPRTTAEEAGALPRLRRWGVRGVILVPAMLYCVAIAWFVSSEFALFHFPLDDAWIHRVYARSMAWGQGLAYNDGVQEAGSTSPLWVLLTAPAHWTEPLGPAVPVIAVKVIGAALGLLAVYAAAAIAGQLSGARWIGLLAGSLFALEPRLLSSALSGMEPVLLLALWAWCCVALVRGRLALSLVLFSLMPVTRPEAVVLLPFSALAIFPLVHRKGVKWLPFAIVPAVPMFVWMVFCYAATGHWLPNTYYVKTSGFHFQWSHLETAGRAVIEHGFGSLLPFALGVAACFALARSERRSSTGICLLMLVAAPLAYLAGVAGTREVLLDGYYWTRWIDPASLVLTTAFCAGYGLIAGLLVEPKRILPGLLGNTNRASTGGDRASAMAGAAATSRRMSRRSRNREGQPHRSMMSTGAGSWPPVVARTAAAVLVLCFVASMPKLGKSLDQRRWQLSADSKAIATMNEAMGQWINEHTPESAVLAVSDAGALRYFGRRRTIDLSALNTSAITFHRTSWQEVLDEADWLAILPRVYQGQQFLEEVMRRFEFRFGIGLTEEEYTICHAPAQSLTAAFEKKRSSQQLVAPPSGGDQPSKQAHGSQ